MFAIVSIILLAFSAWGTWNAMVRLTGAPTRSEPQQDRTRHIQPQWQRCGFSDMAR